MRERVAKFALLPVAGWDALPATAFFVRPAAVAAGAAVGGITLDVAARAAAASLTLTAEPFARIRADPRRAVARATTIDAAAHAAGLAAGAGRDAAATLRLAHLTIGVAAVTDVVNAAELTRPIA